MFLIYYLKIWTLYFGKMQVFAAQTYFEFVAEHDDTFRTINQSIADDIWLAFSV